jgi:hypothetical protein
MANNDRYLSIGVLGGDESRPIKYATDNLNQSLRVAIPGIIKTFNPQEATAEIQPTIMEPTIGDKGATGFEQLPLLVDVPVIFPCGGGTRITWPVEPGDECLVVFADMCIDSWWQSGGIEVQPDIRRHDLSDGFAILAPFSQPKMVGNPIKTDRLEIKTNKGVDITSPGTVNVTGSTTVNINSTGNIVLSGAGVYANGIHIDAWKSDYDSFKSTYNSHTHGGVMGGGGNTGGPSSTA